MENDAFLCYLIYSRKDLFLIKQFIEFLKKTLIKIWPKHFNNEKVYKSLDGLLKKFEETESSKNGFLSKL
jgi:hypothetical protein